MKLTPFAKLFIAGVILGVLALCYFTPSVRNRIMPREVAQSSAVPPKPDLIGVAHAPGAAGCTDKPPIRVYLPAWNATLGLILANGGKNSTADGIFCKRYGLNVELVREDDAPNAYGFLASFAEQYGDGNKNPSKGGPIFIAMGDAGAAHATWTNEKLRKIGPGSRVIIVGASGFSNGEDKAMVKAERAGDPQKLRGSYLAMVPGDGDHLLVLQYAAMNNIPVNPDYKTYDPNAINTAPAKTFTEAAQKYVINFCDDLVNTDTRKTEKHCVDGASTWTPGDVTIFEKKGGAVPIVSTRQFPNQMPATLFVYGPWAEANSDAVAGILAGAFEAADQIQASEEALDRAATLAATVFHEETADYWKTYYKGTTRTDALGNSVSLGGSRVSGYAEINRIFGGTAYPAIYTSFGKMLTQVISNDLPKFDPVENVLDLRYLKLAGDKLRKKNLLREETAATFSRSPIKQVLAHRNWDIKFATGRDDVLPESMTVIDDIATQAVIAGTAKIQIDGHTDDRGNADANMRLSTARANKVRDLLYQKDPAAFPSNRVTVQGFGMSRPVASNATAEGRTLNRRVEITFGN